MHQYLQLVEATIKNGVDRPDRTGTGTRSIFGYQMHFDLQKGFPLVTTKKIHLKSVINELFWFLSGDTNIGYLKQNGVSIWDEWADAEGNLGPIYGHQWRKWGTGAGSSIDQINQVIHEIQHNPYSRRLIVSAWNVTDLSKMALPPCHVLFQFFVAEGKLSCQLYQRSADVFLGLPFNIASYAFLTHMIAQQCNLLPGTFVWSGGDCHLYKNHFDKAEIQLLREPYPLPNLKLTRRPPSIFDYKETDLVIENYMYHPAISAAISV